MTTSSHLFLLLILPILLTPILSQDPASLPISSSAACNSTTYPTFCQTSILPPNSTQNLYSHSRFALTKSLYNSLNFSKTLDHYISSNRSALSENEAGAVGDCQLLSKLNIDFLSATNATLFDSTAANITISRSGAVHTLLSAVITNQQTCSDGLQVLAPPSSAYNNLSATLFNGTMLYSVSLSLFTRAWVPESMVAAVSKTLNKRRLLFHEVEVGHDGRLPLKMSRWNQELFERRSGRRILQVPDSVLISDTVVVNQDGTGNFTTIGDAVNWAPNNTDGSNGYFLVYVNAGVYEEYVSIPKYKKYLMMVGDGINLTVVTGNRSVVDGWTTFNSATFAVVGQGFVAINMTIQNTAGAVKQQAVALRSGADLSTFYLCSFEGYQDTLYPHSMRQFYKNCDIFGTVDFIFGNAAVVLQNCNIHARLPLPGQSDPITAQGRTDVNQNTGTSIQGCNILAAPDLAASNGTTKSYLGRPWKQYSRTVVMQSFIDGLIDPAGWLAWSGDFALSTLYYAEFNNTGPGSDTSNRVTWAGYHVINSSDAVDYTVSSFVLGDFWIPQTGVPYFGGLL